jgi:hypothetical protein
MTDQEKEKEKEEKESKYKDFTFLSLFYPVEGQEETEKELGIKEYYTVTFYPTEEVNTIIQEAGGMNAVFYERDPEKVKEKYEMIKNVADIGTKHVVDFFLDLAEINSREVRALLSKYHVEIKVKEKRMDEFVEYGKMEKEIIEKITDNVEEFKEKVTGIDLEILETKNNGNEQEREREQEQETSD